MFKDFERCRILCELIDREPETSHRAEMYTRLLWQLLDKQLFAIPKDLHWRAIDLGMFAATT
jgi:hypothetical protein